LRYRLTCRDQTQLTIALLRINELRPIRVRANELVTEVGGRNKRPGHIGWQQFVTATNRKRRLLNFGPQFAHRPGEALHSVDPTACATTFICRFSKGLTKRLLRVGLNLVLINARTCTTAEDQCCAHTSPQLLHYKVLCGALRRPATVSSASGTSDGVRFTAQRKVICRLRIWKPLSIIDSVLYQGQVSQF
jgi:hypothetical protein